MAEKTLEEKLLAVITENLPTAQVGILKEALEKGARDAERVKHLEDHIDKRDREVSALRTQLQDSLAAHEGTLKRERALSDRAAEVEKKARDLDNILLRNQLQSVERERDGLMRLSEVVFRNPRHVFNEQVTSSSSRQVKQNWGGSVLEPESASTTTRTTTTEEQ